MMVFNRMITRQGVVITSAQHPVNRITIRMFSGLVLLLILVAFSSCERNVTIESVVHEDGSVDRTIVFLKSDSSKITGNFFGIGNKTGWQTTLEEAFPSEGDVKNEKKYNVTLKKHFASIEDANAEMNTPTDTLFSIHSDFEKKFRWFYTYMKYSDTYRCINRFRNIPLDEYFTAEDFAFIDRLPAEGKPISKADSVYLIMLNEKIFDHFVLKMIFDEHFEMILDVARKNQRNDWANEVKSIKGKMFQTLTKLKDNVSDDFMLVLLDSSRMQLPEPKMKEDYKQAMKDLDRRLSFMTTANETKFLHGITLPWKAVATNADSISGSSLYWRPPVMRFMLKDYTMYAEARRLNYWTVIVSLGIVVLTGIVFLKRR